MTSRIRSVEVFPVAVPFARQFVIGSGSVGAPDQKPDQATAVIFVKLTTEDGVIGWGEQRALPSWSYETAETIAVVIRRHLTPILLELTPFDVELFHSQATKRLSPSVSNGFPFARAAVDLAMHDAAEQAGRSTGSCVAGREATRRDPALLGDRGRSSGCRPRACRTVVGLLGVQGEDRW